MLKDNTQRRCVGTFRGWRRRATAAKHLELRCDELVKNKKFHETQRKWANSLVIRGERWATMTKGEE